VVVVVVVVVVASPMLAAPEKGGAICRTEEGSPVLTAGKQASHAEPVRADARVSVPWERTDARMPANGGGRGVCRSW